MLISSLSYFVSGSGRGLVSNLGLEATDAGDELLVVVASVILCWTLSFEIGKTWKVVIVAQIRDVSYFPPKLGSVGTL